MLAAGNEGVQPRLLARADRGGCDSDGVESQVAGFGLDAGCGVHFGYLVMPSL